MHRLLLALCLVTSAMPAVTNVAYADDPEERAARQHYERGKKLFNLQRFDEALAQFQQAYEALSIPDFLFNIGQCQRNLGDYEAAIFSFKKFLKLEPDAANRDQVEELIEDLQRLIDEGNTERLNLRNKTRTTPAAPAGDRPVYKKWWFWTGVAVLGAGAGVGVYLATKSDAPDTTFGNIVFRR